MSVPTFQGRWEPADEFADEGVVWLEAVDRVAQQMDHEQ